ncbi:hypothetical protein ACTQ44_10090 [Ligilactobacillus ruminis]|uniref:hypothetical protein n=1 Tax=Ligilactobacillus ruminis TaxID=1623 RepID=UPI003F9CAF68
MKNITYMTSLLTFYLKGEISTEKNFLSLKIPNTVLALIPLGAQKHNVPVNQLSAVSTSFSLAFKELIIGIIEALFGFASIESSFLVGLIILLVGISTIITSFKTELRIDTTSGRSYLIPFVVFEKSKAAGAEEMLNEIISNRLNDTNSRQVTEKQTDAVVDAINNLNK